VGNTFPACRAAHQDQHARGIRTFELEWNLDLAAIAADLAAGYPGETDPT